MNNLQDANQGQVEQVPFGTVQHNLSNIMPMSSEISHLWNSYLAENMSVAMLKHFVAKSKDPDIHNVLQRALDISSQRVKSMEDIFNSIPHPIPEGFGEKDVDINARELFSESYSLRYSRLMSKFILLNYSLSFSDSSRTDFRNFFSECINTSKEVIEKANDILLAKGLFPKSPYITIPDRVEYVDNVKSYFGSFFESDRPLNVIEISNIYQIMDFKMAVRALKLGFAQVIKSDELRNHVNRGLEIADKQLEILGSLLNDEGLPGPELINYQVTDSKESPYSDKLMMYHVTATFTYILTAYGLALTNTMRKDIGLTLSRLMAEIIDYTKDGVELLIENRWLERVPETANRKKLTH